MKWSKKSPTIEGWYFWRKRQNQNNPWLWDVYYIMPPDETDEDREWTYWTGGVDCWKPAGGWWSPRIEEPVFL